MLRAAYTFFIGLLLAIFAGYGIATFYPAPAQPKAPCIIANGKTQPTAEDQAAERAFNAQMDAYTDAIGHYNQRVALLALGAAIVFVALGLLVNQRLNVFANGLTLGGLFTLLYCLGRSFASQNSKFSFLMVSGALLFIGLLGYWRFSRLGHRWRPLPPSPAA